MKLRIISAEPYTRLHTLKPTINITDKGAVTFSLAAVVTLGLVAKSKADIVVDDETGTWYAVFAPVTSAHQLHTLLPKKKGTKAAAQGKCALGYNHAKQARELLAAIEAGDKKSVTLEITTTAATHEGKQLYAVYAPPAAAKSAPTLVSEPVVVPAPAPVEPAPAPAAKSKKVATPVEPKQVVKVLKNAVAGTKAVPVPAAAAPMAAVSKESAPTSPTLGPKRPIRVAADASDDRLVQRREYLLGLKHRLRAESDELGKINKELQKRGHDVIPETY